MILGFIILLFVGFDFIKVEQKKKINKYMLFFISMSMIMLTGLRDNVGADYYNYLDIYNNVNAIDEVILGNINYFDIHGEYGYLLLNSLVKSILGEFTIVLLIMAFFSIGLVSYACYKYSYFTFTSLLIYYIRFYFLRDMDQIRSSVACGIILFSIDAIVRRRFLQFCVLTGIAMLFHKAALIVLPVYFLSKYNIKEYIYYRIIFVAFVIGVLVPFKDVLSTYFWDINSVVIKYALESEFAKELGIFHLVNIMQTFFLIVFLAKRDKLKNLIYGYDVMLNMYAVSTFWMLSFQSLGIIAARFSTMITTVEVILVPSIILAFRENSSKYVALIFVLLLLAVQVYFRIEAGMFEYYLPYKTIFG